MNRAALLRQIMRASGAETGRAAKARAVAVSRGAVRPQRREMLQRMSRTKLGAMTRKGAELSAPEIAAIAAVPVGFAAGLPFAQTMTRDYPLKRAQDTFVDLQEERMRRLWDESGYPYRRER